MTNEEIEKNILEIRERNKRVEADKAWETSFTRRASIAVLTYCVALVIMYFLGVENIYFSALIPTGGYILSTLSLPVIKQHWLTRYHNRNEKV